MKQLKISFIFFAAMSLFPGLLYPVMMTLAAQIAFPGKANGSLIIADGRIVGSALVNKKLIDRVAKQAVIVRKENNLPAGAEIPADLVLASGSGLDPHISLESALLQTPRIAHARGMDALVVTGLVEKSGEKQYFGLFGNSFVNVLELNLALDAMSTRR